MRQGGLKILKMQGDTCEYSLLVEGFKARSRYPELVEGFFETLILMTIFAK